MNSRYSGPLMALLAGGLAWGGAGKAVGETVIYTNSATVGVEVSLDGADVQVQGCSIVFEGDRSFASLFVVSNGLAEFTSTNLAAGQMDLAEASSVVLAGGTALAVSNGLTLTNGSTLRMRSCQTDAPVGEQWVGQGGSIAAAQAWISPDSAIAADGEGYPGGDGESGDGTGAGPGGGSGSTNCVAAGGGGGHGGQGADGGGMAGGGTYGLEFQPRDLGSGGGGGGCGKSGGAGGGAIRLAVAETLTLDGIIQANGAAAVNGGGAGGSLWVRCGTLAGTGRFAADGGNGNLEAEGAGGGAGGRIAVYYETQDLFAGFSTSSATGGTGVATGEVGTVYFFESPAEGTDWVIRDTLDVRTNRTLALDSIRIEEGGTLRLGGGSTLMVAGTIEVKSNGTLLCLGNQISNRVAGTWAGEGATMQASQVVVQAGGRITADGQGYAGAWGTNYSGFGPGGGTGIPGCNGGRGAGATHGGAGGTGWIDIAPSARYGNSLAPVEPGSGGGIGNCGERGGNGGGAIRLTVLDSLLLDGTISANGECLGSGGGGSGGSLYVTAGTLAGEGLFTADGSAGGTGGAGGGGASSGGGGGGRILVEYGTDGGFSRFADCSAEGGTAYSNAFPGTVAFICTTNARRNLNVYRDFDLGEARTLALTGIEVHSNGHFFVQGGSELAVAGNVEVASGGLLECGSIWQTERVNGVWMGQGISLRASNLTVQAGGRLSADGQGYLGETDPLPGNGPGGGQSHPGCNGGYGAGGGHGGWGGSAHELVGGSAHGDAFRPLDPGSGGGGGNCSQKGGNGGGALFLAVDNALQVDGEITARGASVAWGAGGGAGGSIYVEAGRLSGAGFFNADGGLGDPEYYWGGGGGGGGRIAVYYGADDGFEGWQTSTANGGTGMATGSVGTVAFVDESATNGAVHVFTAFAMGPNDAGQMNSLTVHTNARLWMQSGLVCRATGDVRIESGAEVRCGSGDLSISAEGNWIGRGVSWLASNVVLETGAVVSADGEGYAEAVVAGARANGPGGGISGSGGGHGGNGADTGWSAEYKGGLMAGNAAMPLQPGSGGGGTGNTYTGPGGAGGGAICMALSGALVNDGTICANGQNAQTGYAGGGGGGSILISASSVSGTGQYRACGGDSGTPSTTGGGGAGGGGRIAIYAWETNAVDTAQAAVAPGTSYYPAASGSVLLSVEPYAYVESGAELIHGTETLRWGCAGIDPGTASVRLVAARDGEEFLLAEGLEIVGQYDWATDDQPDGRCEIRAIFEDGDGAALFTASRVVVVNNAVTWHATPLTNSETWASGTVHVVEGNVSVLSGATLTIEAGAVLKFTDGATLMVLAGGTIQVQSTEANPCVFTSIHDDAAGGDSNLDGAQTEPRPGQWNGIGNQGGTLDLPASAEVRYSLTVHSGFLSGSEVWMGNMVHHVVDDVTVNMNTLTINPGAIVKFAPGVELELYYGQLVANGTVAQPILFTSERDDAAGGDTNEDGDRTEPFAGDWSHVTIEGRSTGILRHVEMRYGGANLYGSSWNADAVLRIYTSTNCLLLAENCVLRDSIFDGFYAEGPGVATFDNCVFAGNDRGVNVHVASEVTLRNCTFHDNRWGLLPHGGKLNAINTVVSESHEYGVYDAGGTNEYRHLDVWSSRGTNYFNMDDPTGTNGNLSVEPGFRDAERGNFRPGYSSPLIDAGDTPEAPEFDAGGAPRYDDPRTPNVGVPLNGAVADIGAYEFAETADADVDLRAEDATGPAAGTADGWATVTWKIRNAGIGMVQGAWHDAVHLTPDEPGEWDGEQLVAETLSSGTLGPGQTKAFSAQVRIPGGTEGPWRWRVKANSSGDVFEGRHWQNNLSDPSAAMALAVPSLELGVATQSEFRSETDSRCFKVEQAAGQELSIALDAASTNGRIRIHAGFGQMPSDAYFDLRSALLFPPDAQMGLPAPAAARTVYLRAMQESPLGTNRAFALVATPAEFGLDSVGVVRAGNVGDATFPVAGRQLDEWVAMRLEPAAGGETLTAFTNVPVDASLLYATFDLRGAIPGTYHLTAERAGSTRTLTNAVTIVAGAGARFETRVVMPERVRHGRWFTAHVEYENAGDADMPAPLVHVEPDDGDVEFRLPDSTNEMGALSFLGTAVESARPGTLYPGASGRFSFQIREFNVPYLQVHTRFFEGADETAMDYAALEAAVRPPVPHPLWTGAWQRVAAQAGPTQGDYVEALDGAADRGRVFGLELRTEADLLAFLIREAMEQVEAGVVRGTIRDGSAGNAPIARGIVTLTATNDLCGTGTLYSASSWYDGTFSIRDVPAGDYEISVEDYLPKRAAQVAVIDPESPVTGIDVVVTARCARVFGTVAAESGGETIDDGGVMLVETVGDEVFASAVENGQYEISDVPPGAYELSVEIPGYAPQPVRQIALAAGQRLRLPLTATTNGSALSGTVFSSAGAPLSNATVSATWLDYAPAYGAWMGAAATCGTNGSYGLSALPAGRYRVVASAADIGISAASNVVLASAEANLNLTLQAGHAVSGRVVEAGSGAAVTNARVVAATAPPCHATATTDENGAFCLEGIPAGTCVVWAGAPAFQKQSAEVSVPQAETNWTIALPRLGSVSGTLRNDGQSLAGVRVVLMSLDYGAWAETWTDATGAYRFDGVTTGSYVVVVSDSGRGSLESEIFEIGATNALVEQTFDMVLSSVTGRVVQADGETPATNATIYLVEGNERLAWCDAGSAGTFRFDLLSTGTYSLVACGESEWFAPACGIEIAAPGDEAGAVLASGTNSIDMRVKDADGAAVEAAWVVLVHREDASGATVRASDETDEAGQAVFAGLPDGEYGYRVQAAGFALSEGALATGSAEPCEVTLAAGRILSGVVTTNGTRAAFATVDVCSPTGSIALTTWTDEEGNYAFDMVPSGIWDVVATAGSDWGAEIRTGVDLASRTNALEVFALAAASTSTLSGVVRDASGRGVVGADVRMQSRHGRELARGSADACGNFSIAGAPDGAIRLLAAAPGCRSGGLDLTTTSGVSQAGLELSISDPVVFAVQAEADGSGGLLAREARSETYTGQENVWRRTSASFNEFWADLLGGLNAVPDPSFYHYNIGLTDETTAHTVSAAEYDWKYNHFYAYWQSKLDDDGRWKCQGVAEAYFRGGQVRQEIARYYRLWRDNYESLRELDAAEAGLVLSQGALVGMKLIKLIGDIAGVTPDSTLAGVVDGVGGILSFGLQAQAQGKFDTLGACLTAGQTTINTYNLILDAIIQNGAVKSHPYNVGMLQHQIDYLKGLNATTAGAPYQKAIDALEGHMSELLKSPTPPFAEHFQKVGKWLGNIAGIADLVNECMSLKDSIGRKNANLVQGCTMFMWCQDVYYRHVKEFYAAKREMLARMASCKTGDGSEPGGGGTSPGSSVNVVVGGEPGGTGNASGVGGLDPNDKLTTGVGTQRFVMPGQRIHYAIRFENVATATAPAQVVRVIDRLEDGLDFGSVELGEIGFNNVELEVPSGLTQFSTNGIAVATDPNRVRVAADCDPDTREITWTLSSYDPATGAEPEDPLAGFLPPNTTNAIGEGEVNFSVLPASNLTAGATITNVALIYFDYNPAIPTPTVTNTVDRLPPASAAESPPRSETSRFAVTWGGDDGEGAGVGEYDVYVSRDGGAWTRWLTGRTNEMEEFVGEPGVQYRFFSVARDAAGNWESAPKAAEAETRVDFHLVPANPESESDLLRWESATGKVYAVEMSTGLVGSAWAFTNVDSALPATPPINVFTNPPGMDRRRILRIKAMP